MLAAAIRREPFDLVLCATESGDSDAGIVPGQLAQRLGIAALTFAKEIMVGRRSCQIAADLSQLEAIENAQRMGIR